MKWWRWKYLGVLSLAGLGLGVWAFLPSDLMVSLEGPLGVASFTASLVLSAVAIPFTLLGARELVSVTKQAQALAKQLQLQEKEHREQAQSWAEELRLQEEQHQRQAQIWAEQLRLREEQHQRQAQSWAEQHRRFVHNLDELSKNHLTVIQGGLDSLAQMMSDSEQPATLDSVKNGTRRMKGLVVSLRKLDQLEDIPLEPEPVDVESLLWEVCDWAQQHLAAPDREFVFRPPALILSPVAGEEDLLYQALCNLVDNAMKYTRPGAGVEMRAFEDGDSVLLEITDTGRGIAESEIPYIWEPLFRGKGFRDIPGSGVGLALVKAIVDRHGGHISVRSREGQGTAFALRLPVM